VFEFAVMSKRGKAEKRAARDERLSAALRENLKRRKVQARGRASAASGDTAKPENADLAQPAPDFRRNPVRE